MSTPLLEAPRLDCGSPPMRCFGIKNGSRPFLAKSPDSTIGKIIAGARVPRAAPNWMILPDSTRRAT